MAEPTHADIAHRAAVAIVTDVDPRYVHAAADRIAGVQGAGVGIVALKRLPSAGSAGTNIGNGADAVIIAGHGVRGVDASKRRIADVIGA